MKTVQPTDDVWESCKENIFLWYLIEDRTLAEVQRLVSETYHVTVTKAQLEHRFDQWNFRKNLTKNEWRTVMYKCHKRKRDNIESEICVNGLPMNQKKVRKAFQRYANTLDETDTTAVASPRTPQGVTIRTPVIESAEMTMTRQTSPQPIFTIPPVVDPISAGLGPPSWDALPFLQFQMATKGEAAERFVEILSEGNPIPQSGAERMRIALVAHFGNRHLEEGRLDSLSTYLRMLMPNRLFLWRNHCQRIVARDELSPRLDSLTLILFMISNNLWDSTTEASGKLCQWTSRIYLDHLLSGCGPTGEALSEQFFSIAMEKNDIASIERLLQVGLDPNKLRCSNKATTLTPLQFACSRHSMDLVKVLLRRGADVNQRVLGTSSPLTLALMPDILAPSDRQTDIRLVNLLLDHGAEVNPSGHQSPLLQAAAMSYHAIVDLLIAKGADVNFTAANLEGTPLSVALRSRVPVEQVTLIVKSLLRAGSDVNAVVQSQTDEKTMLMLAIELSDPGLVGLLLTEGACATKQALELAIGCGYIDVIAQLINFGAPVEPTMLAQAAIHGSDILRLLRNAASKSFDKRDFGDALTSAIQHGIIELITELAESPLRYGLPLVDAIEATVLRGDISTLGMLLNERSIHRAIAMECLGCSLYHAIANRRIDMVELLMEASAPLDAPEQLRGRTPLLEAIEQQDIQLSRLLLKAGASINIRNSDATGHVTFTSVLPAAVRWGHLPLVEELINAGAHVNSLAPGLGERQTALTIAIERRDFTMVKRLLCAGADVNATEVQRSEHTALAASIRCNDINLILDLLNLGADPDDSALIAAIQTNCGVLQVLITTKRSRCIYLPQEFGCRALQYAMSHGKLNAVETLLRNGINPNVIPRPPTRGTNYGVTRLMSSTCESPFGTALALDETDNLDVVKLFLRYNADVNAVVSYQANDDDNDSRLTTAQTALLAAIDRKHFTLVEELISAGADVNLRPTPRFTQTPLQAAVERGAMDIVEVLLERGADVNALPHDQFGATALQYAAIEGFFGMTVVLLEHGADVNAPPSKLEGRTALEGASEHGRLDIVQLLLSAGAAITGPGSEQYRRACEFAADEGHLAVKRLLERCYNQQTEMMANPNLLDTNLDVPSDLDFGEWLYAEQFFEQSETVSNQHGTAL